MPDTELFKQRKGLLWLTVVDGSVRGSLAHCFWPYSKTAHDGRGSTRWQGQMADGTFSVSRLKETEEGVRDSTQYLLQGHTLSDLTSHSSSA